jgi:hypothetical protein
MTVTMSRLHVNMSAALETLIVRQRDLRAPFTGTNLRGIMAPWDIPVSFPRGTRQRRVLEALTALGYLSHSIGAGGVDVWDVTDRAVTYLGYSD